MTILDEIIEKKRIRIAKAKQKTDVVAFTSIAGSSRPENHRHRFRAAIADRSRINIIAEFKRASPSKGRINAGADAAGAAIKYQQSGAAAISVLTEEDFFMGSAEDLAAVRNAVDIPILRKDFVIDDFQVYESAVMGADAILLIVAALSPEMLRGFQSLAWSLGLDVIVEVHDRSELEIAIDLGAEIIGINNRDLKTFDVSLDISRELVRAAPENAVMIAESGITNFDEIAELHDLGFSGFLIGEALMRSSDPEHELKLLTANRSETD